MHYLQVIFMIFGFGLVVIGIYLFIIKGTEGKNRIKLLGIEFELSGSSLVIFVIGVLLIIFPIFYSEKFPKSDQLRNSIYQEQKNNDQLAKRGDENRYKDSFVIIDSRYSKIEFCLQYGVFYSEEECIKKIEEILKETDTYEKGDLSYFPTPDIVWHLLSTDDEWGRLHYFFATKEDCERKLKLDEFEGYLKLQEKVGYRVITVACENIEISEALNFIQPK